MSNPASRSWVAPTVVSIVGTALAAYLLAYDSYSLLWPDSGSYIHWEIARSAGYPLLLWAVGLFSTDLAAMRPTQMALLVGAAALLTAALEALLKARGVPAARVIAIGGGVAFVANTALMRFGLSILSEAPFAAFVAANLAFFVLLAIRPRPWTCLAFALTLAAAVLIRPAGLSLLLSIPMLLALPDVPGRRVFGYVVLPLGLILLTAAAANYWRAGVFALQEMGGISLAGHVASLAPDHLETAHPVPTNQIVSDLTSWRTQEAASTWPQEAYEFTTVEYNPMVHIVVGRFGDYVDGEARAGRVSSLPKHAVVNRLCHEFALSVIRQAPFAYLRHVAAHLYGIWVLPQWRPAPEVEAMKTRFASTDRVPSPVSNYEAHLLEFVSGRTPLFLLATRVTLAVVLLSSIAGMLAPFRLGLRDPLVATWFFASTNLHAAFLLVCAVQAASWRYSIVWWGHAVVSVVLCAILTARRARG
jgi:hypothetical protein